MNFLLKLGTSESTISSLVLFFFFLGGMQQDTISFSILTDPVTMSKDFNIFQKLLMLCLILKCASKITDWR